MNNYNVIVKRVQLTSGILQLGNTQTHTHTHTHIIQYAWNFQFIFFPITLIFL